MTFGLLKWIQNHQNGLTIVALFRRGFSCHCCIDFFENANPYGRRSTSTRHGCVTIPAEFRDNCFFCVVLCSSFFHPQKTIFLSFWLVLGTSEIDPDPPKTMKTLESECDPWKIMFFYKKNDHPKKHQKWLQQNIQKDVFSAIFALRSLTFHVFLDGRFFLAARGPFWSPGVPFCPPGPHFGPILNLFWSYFGAIFT